MNKDKILFGVMGLLIGLIVGFMFANSINKNGTIVAAPTEIKTNSNLPPGHPDIGSSNKTGGTSTAQPEIQAAIEKAKKSPSDVEAQIAAAEAYSHIEKFDEAIKYLQAANKLKPDDREVTVHLGNANFDAERYNEAEKWYMSALAKKADDINVRTDLGLTFVFREPPNYDRAIQEFNRALEIDPNHIQSLQNITVAYTKKGDAAKATAALAKLEIADPANKSIAKLREDIKNIGGSK